MSFPPAGPLSLDMKLDGSPIVYPAVAGSPEPVLGQASVLLGGYLPFNPLGVGNRAVYHAPGERHTPPRFVLWGLKQQKLWEQGVCIWGVLPQPSGV